MPGLEEGEEAMVARGEGRRLLCMHPSTKRMTSLCSPYHFGVLILPAKNVWKRGGNRGKRVKIGGFPGGD